MTDYTTPEGRRRAALQFDSICDPEDPPEIVVGDCRWLFPWIVWWSRWW